jgi:hypothetical protein
MERSWYWRVALIVGVAIFSVYQLVPSWFYFKLPPDQRNGEAYDKSVPDWAPNANRHLNLGLDLQGGIHLAMGVDVDRAVKAKVARRADEISDFLKSKSVPFESVATTGGGTQVEVKTASPDQVKSAVLDSYDQEMYAPSVGDGAVRFAFKDTVLRDFQAKAVEQAEKTIRNRGRHRARHQAEGEQPDPDPAPRLQGSGEGEGAARSHRPARVQDHGRREPRARSAARAAPGVLRAGPDPAPAPAGGLLVGGDDRAAERRRPVGDAARGQHAARA